MRISKLTAQQKADVSTACEAFIADTLKPRYLPQIRPTTFNYPIDLLGRWRGRSYSFITRYRSGYPENAGEEFDAPFTRLEHREDILTEVRFDIHWMRHTGRWWPLHSGFTLEDALRQIKTQEMLGPSI